ncbi:MAG TPA: MFS transporter, partial [Planctomycetota bacterium]|nr:MFS transporter [Planctomycetota bacterium]
MSGPWWKTLNGYMWWVLIVAALGWVFDVVDQRIFVLSRGPALDDLLSVELEESELNTKTAAEIAALLGVEPGAEPATEEVILRRVEDVGEDIVVLRDPEPEKVKIEEPAAGTRARPAIILPPAEPGGKPRRFSFVRPADAPGRVRIAPDRSRNELIGRIATAIFLAGWATGGLVFGVLGDRWGRARTMMLTILVYSVFTGLSALSVTWVDYSVYRFLTGMGVGGEFAAGAALVAEVMPARARPYALGLLQALSALGNIMGSLIARVVLPPSTPGEEWEKWRMLYVVGIFPALLIVVIRGRLKEPERWRAVKESAGQVVGKQLGAFGDLFQSRWRRSTYVGMTLAVTGVIGLWGIGFWTPELIQRIVPDQPEVRTYATALQDVGAFLGIAAIALVTEGAPRSRTLLYLGGLAVCATAAAASVFQGGGSPGSAAATAWLGVTLSGVGYFLLALLGTVTGGLGRRSSFVLSFILAFLATIMVFRYMTRPEQVYWMTPLLGFTTLLCFGMYAIYFPELYPTRLRTTGTGFCYNVARYIAAGGLILLGYIGTMLELRISTQIFALIYFVGIAAA